MYGKKLLVMRSLLCLPLHFVNSLMHYTCFCLLTVSVEEPNTSMSHSWRPASHFDFFGTSHSVACHEAGSFGV